MQTRTVLKPTVASLMILALVPTAVHAVERLKGYPHPDIEFDYDSALTSARQQVLAERDADREEERRRAARVQEEKAQRERDQVLETWQREVGIQARIQVASEEAARDLERFKNAVNASFLARKLARIQERIAIQERNKHRHPFSQEELPTRQDYELLEDYNTAIGVGVPPDREEREAFRKHIQDMHDQANTPREHDWG